MYLKCDESPTICCYCFVFIWISCSLISWRYWHPYKQIIQYKFIWTSSNHVVKQIIWYRQQVWISESLLDVLECANEIPRHSWSHNSQNITEKQLIVGRDNNKKQKLLEMWQNLRKFNDKIRATTAYSKPNKKHSQAQHKSDWTHSLTILQWFVGSNVLKVHNEIRSGFGFGLPWSLFCRSW